MDRLRCYFCHVATLMTGHRHTWLRPYSKTSIPLRFPPFAAFLIVVSRIVPLHGFTPPGPGSGVSGVLGQRAAPVHQQAPGLLPHQWREEGKLEEVNVSQLLGHEQ